MVAAEPYNRDALSSLANTYLALKNGPKLLATAQRLVEIEPMSESALKLLGEGYKQSSKVDEAVKTAEQVLALPANVTGREFRPDRRTARSLTLTATGRAAQTPAGKPIAPAAGPHHGRVHQRRRPAGGLPGRRRFRRWPDGRVPGREGGRAGRGHRGMALQAEVDFGTREERPWRECRRSGRAAPA